MATKSEKAAPAADTLKAILLIGRDTTGQPHAACFAARSAKAAETCATALGLALHRVNDDKQLAIAKTVPEGKLYDNGRAFVPYVREEMFAELAALLPEGFEWPTVTPVGAECLEKSIFLAGKGGEALGPGAKDHWQPPMVGQIVLAYGVEWEGWFDAEITSIEPNGLYVMKWREAPELGPITRRIEHIGLVHSAYVAPAA